MITTGHFLGGFTYVSNDAEAEKACVHFKFMYLSWVIFFHFIADLTLVFSIKRNYCFHRWVDSMRSTTGFWCWYPVFIGNRDRACYIKIWFLFLFPAFFYQEENLVVYPSFPSGMICTPGWILHTACQRIIFVGCDSSI